MKDWIGKNKAVFSVIVVLMIIVSGLSVLTVVNATGSGGGNNGTSGSTGVTPNTVTTLGAGSAVGTYSYIIFTDGSGNYFAKNGTTGAVDYSNLNLNSVVQWIINDTYANSIFIDSGNYITEQGIYTKSNLLIDGNGNSTQIELANNVGESVFNCINVDNVTIENIGINGNNANNNIYGFIYGVNIDGDSTGINLNNLNIENTYHSGIFFAKTTSDIIVSYCSLINDGYTGLYASGVWCAGSNSTVENCYCKNCNSCGILVNGDPGSPAENDIVSNNVITGNTSRGIDIESYVGKLDNIINNNINNLSGNTYGNNTATGIYCASPYILINGNVISHIVYEGIALNTQAIDCTVSNNIIDVTGSIGISAQYSYSTIENNYVSNTGSNGIKADYVDGNTVSYTGNSGIVALNASSNIISYVTDGISIYAAYAQVEGNTISYCSLYGIETNGYSHLTITGNFLNDNTGANIHMTGSSNDIITNNYGWNTIFEGTATITNGTSVTFSDNLVSTPTIVIASFSSSNYGSYTWTATSTTITITVTTSGTYTVYWYAQIVY